MGCDRRLWVKITHLTKEHGEVAPVHRWYYWVDHPCPDLPQDIDGGKIRSVEVSPSDAAGPLPKGRGWERVWLLDDVDLIVRRRTAPAGRKADPDGLGHWLTDDIFQLDRDMGPQDPATAAGLRKGDLLFRDKLAAEQVGVTATVPGWWRRHRLSCLDPSVNGGRLRHLRVCQRAESRRAARVPVSAQTDLGKITAAREVQKSPAGDLAGIALGDLARAMGIGHEDRARYGDLKLAFQRFREEVPTAARESWRWDGRRNRSVKEWRCDHDAFRRWLGKRDIRQVATEAKKAAWEKRAQVGGRGLKNAIAFLQFVLTHGRYGPRLFRRFLDKLSDAGTLPPCGFVPAADIKRWAQLASISEWHLWPAKKALPIEHRSRGGRASDWRLTEPVVISRPASQSVTPAALEPPIEVGESLRQDPGQPAARRRGRRASEKTAKVYEFCYGQYMDTDNKLAVIRERARVKYGAKAPKKDAHVCEYARRHATRNGLPFTLRTERKTP